MLFSSIPFIFAFLPFFLLIYYITPARLRNVPLFFGSLLFYALGELKYFPLLIATLVFNYVCSLLIDRADRHIYIRKLLLTAVVLSNFLTLIWFKYFTAAIPLGISFYTFQITAYVIDVYRKKNEPAKNILEIGVYLCLFPQLIAGPVILYNDMISQLRSRSYCAERFEAGLRTFILGLSSKILIADVMGKLWNEICVTGFESISTPMAWLGAAAYSMEIFFDFNGYSLMAVGLGDMLGVRIPENFKKPYLSLSVSEFWTRWHVTLGRWFKEYVYIPLGGSRKGILITLRNLFVVWIFTGMWHGKGFSFILWAMVSFLLISLEKLGFRKFLEKHRIFARIYVCLYIPLSWMLFAINSIPAIGTYFSRLFPFFTKADPVYYINSLDVVNALSRYGIFLILALLLCTELPSRIYDKYKNRLPAAVLLLALFALSVVSMIKNASNPFLYFRF